MRLRERTAHLQSAVDGHRGPQPPTAMSQHELSVEQRRTLQSRLSMVQELLALPSVRKHDTRFEHEVALVSPGSELAQVTAIVEKHLGPALKPAGVEAPSEG